MKKIAFYLDSQGSKDCTDIKRSNPGLGGTEYLFILIATLLSERNNGIDVILLSSYKGILPSSLKREAISSLQAASNYVLINNYDYLIVNYTSIDKNIVDSFPNVSYIVWCHNFVYVKDWDYFSSRRNIIRLICVGHEQLDLCRDHPIFNKSDYIFNPVPYESLLAESQSAQNRDAKGKNILYIGSLIECKGFLYLARAWKKILAVHKDANLYVIGKGNLYDENAKLGPLGLSDSRFESAFLPYLSDTSGKILPSVHFLGILGEEKYSVMKKMKVGVPNPGGETETFGLTAVEMQMMGIDVTTIVCPGYLDTVYNKANLYNNTKQLASYVINLLNSEHAPDNNSVRKFVKDNFSYDVIVPQWEKLLCNCIDNNLYLHARPCSNISYNYHSKKIKECLRKIKGQHPLMKLIPSVESFYELKAKIISKIKKFHSCKI